MAPPVKVGLNIVWVQTPMLAEYAQLAERCGYESLWSGEHICLSTEPDWWRGFPGGAALGDAFTADMVPFTPDSDFPDPLVVLAHLASVTTRVRLGVGIYMLALRDPVLVGKTLATLDVISNGRIDLAVGLGWTPDEYSWTGNDWKVRGRRMNEVITALHVLFEQEHPEFHGEFFDFGPMGFKPKPVQKPMPIHIGGGAGPAVKRAGKLGNGWYGNPADIPAIRDELAANGRRDVPFEFSTITLFGPVPMEQLEAMAALGVDRVVVTPWAGTKVGTVGREGLAVVEEYARSIGLTAS
ncbi:MAG: TIGR03619 family F420-dependent LLM class oxidoreductase [Acidimicrobiia bacterium]